MVPIAEGFFEFGVNKNDETVRSRARRFKGEKGKKYRLSFAWWDKKEDGAPNLDGDTPKFVGVKRLFHQDVGYVTYKGPEYAELLSTQPRLAIGTVVAVWPTNDKGQLDKTRLAEVQILPWVFDQGKYEAFSPLHEEFHFGSHDMGAHCTDSQFQKMTFSTMKDGVLRMILENEKVGDLRQRIIGEIYDVASRLPREMAQDLSLADIREKLGGGVSTSPSMSTGTVAAVDDVLEDLLGSED